MILWLQRMLGVNDEPDHASGVELTMDEIDAILGADPEMEWRRGRGVERRHKCSELLATGSVCAICGERRAAVTGRGDTTNGGR